MSDEIRMGTNANLTVAEAARDDGLILGVADANGDTDGEDEDERANRSLAAFAQEADR